MDKTSVKIISYFESLEELLIGLLFFSIPFGWTLSIVPLILFTITLLVNVFTKPEKPSIEKLLYFAPLLCFYIWGAISLFYSDDKAHGLSTLSTQLAIVVSSIAFLFNKISKKLVEKGFFMFLVGCVTSALILVGIAIFKSSSIVGDALIFRPFFESLELTMLDTDTKGIHFLGADFSHFIHPAYAALMFSIAMILILSKMKMSSKELKHKTFWLIGFTLLGICMISFSLNGTLILSAAVILISMGALSLQKIHYGEISNAIYTILFLLLAFTAINPQLQSVINKQDCHSIEQRKKTLETSGMLIAKNWVTGVGIGDERTELRNTYIELGETEFAKRKINSHNQFLTTWIQSGIIGVLLLIWVFFTISYRAYKTHYHLLHLFNVVCFISFMFESFLVRYTGVLTFSIFYGMLYFYSMQEKVHTLRENNT